MSISASSPPRLLTRIIGMCTRRSLRPAVLGDLQEEYLARAAVDRSAADRWYIHQAIASVPHLAGMHLFQLSGVLAATVAGCLLIAVVDIYVARKLAGAYFRAAEVDSYLLPRLIYFTVKLLGVFFAGLLVSLLLFRRDQAFWRNVRLRLLPLGVALFLPATWLLIFQSENYHVGYRLLWVVGLVPCLLTGAWVGKILQRHLPRRRDGNSI